MTQAKAAFLHIVRHPIAMAALAALGVALVILAAVAGFDVGAGARRGRRGRGQP